VGAKTVNHKAGSMKIISTLLLAALFSASAISACEGKDGEKSKTKDKTKTEQSR
jgi:hypothetical protein